MFGETECVVFRKGTQHSPIESSLDTTNIIIWWMLYMTGTWIVFPKYLRMVSTTLNILALSFSSNVTIILQCEFYFVLKKTSFEGLKEIKMSSLIFFCGACTERKSGDAHSIVFMYKVYFLGRNVQLSYSLSVEENKCLLC